MALLDAPKVNYGGTYRAVCLDVLPDRVQVQVPQVFGTTVVTIFEFAGPRPVEGNEGWVVFESGLAERPVWCGSESSTALIDLKAVVAGNTAAIAANTAADAVLSGRVSVLEATPWIDDHLRNPIVRTGGVNETRGSTVVAARYRVVNGKCQWQGHYQLGSGVFWTGGALVLVLPVNPEGTTFVTSFASMPGEIVRGYNGTGFFPGYVEYNGGAGLGTASCFNQSQEPAASAAWSTSVPFTWGSGHILSWNLEYPVS